MVDYFKFVSLFNYYVMGTCIKTLHSAAKISYKIYKFYITENTEFECH